MHTWIKLGPVTLAFRSYTTSDENGPCGDSELCPVFKAEAYNRKKPDSWRDNDYYVTVNFPGSNEDWTFQNRLCACFIGEGKVEITGLRSGKVETFDKPPARYRVQDRTLTIKVTAENKTYQARIHVINSSVEQSKSSGITYNDQTDEWEFDTIGLVDTLLYLFQGEVYYDPIGEFSVHGHEERRPHYNEQPQVEIEPRHLNQETSSPDPEPHRSHDSHSSHRSSDDVTPHYFDSSHNDHGNHSSHNNHSTYDHGSSHSSHSYDSHSHHDSGSCYDSGGSYDSGGGGCGGFD